ncbi:MAG: hypothetical protein ACRDJH_23005 [Thermomicrobiales bacterium]
MPLEILIPDPDILVHKFSDEEIALFLERDRLSPEAEAIVRHFEENDWLVPADER